MGAVQSVIPSEAVVAGALVAGTATAYAVFKRVTDMPGRGSTEEKPASASATAATPGSKKPKSKKKKDAAAGKSDAELDEIVERAKAEAAAEKAKAEARRAMSKLVPGAFDATDAASTAASSEAEGSKGKKSRKKGKKAGAAGASAPAPSSSSTKPLGDIVNEEKEAPAASRSKTFDEIPSPESGGRSKKSKKRKGAKAENAGSKSGAHPSNAPSLQSSQAPRMSVTLSDAPEDASWTRVSTRKKTSQPNSSGRPRTAQTDAELVTSDINLTTGSVTEPENDNNSEEDEGSVQEPGNRRTFAQRVLPRPRKTGVEDMEEEPLQPTLARVMRVKPAAGEKPAKGFTWGDYEEYANMEEETSADGDTDDAWEEVKSKKKNKLDRSSSALTSSVDSLSQSSAPAAPLTKRQRQNAERREAEKRAKEAAERERLERLAKHRKELERTRIEEQYPKSGSGGKKNVSGGMKASVEEGKLVWD